ncbi:hypothetical protein KAT55_05500 [Candidatus Bathyarchaeota archaeon]|nr:hypothetical protein [Candidatus Bathyarchaeota archaeon]
MADTDSTISDPRLPRLLDEGVRVSTPDGFVSIYPNHIDTDGLPEMVQNRGYWVRDSYSDDPLHDGHLERGTVYNFTSTNRLCV